MIKFEGNPKMQENGETLELNQRLGMKAQMNLEIGVMNLQKRKTGAMTMNSKYAT